VFARDKRPWEPRKRIGTLETGLAKREWPDTNLVLRREPALSSRSADACQAAQTIGRDIIGNGAH